MAQRGKYNTPRERSRSDFDRIRHILENVPQPSDDLEQRIINAAKRTNPTENRQSAPAWLLRSAAALLLMIGAGIWVYYSSVDDAGEITSVTMEPARYTTERGEIIEMHLTDEMYVQLNAETELRVLSRAHDATPKLVYLSGEAYFNISRAPEGFEVITKAGLIQVIGTAFNVRAREDEVEVAVASGLIALRGLPEEDIDTVVQVPAGHRSVKQRNTPALLPLPVDIDNYLSWRKGRFVFEQTPLYEVIRNLERAYNVQIDLHDTELGTIRVTGEFGQEPLTRILNDICWSANLRFRQDDDKYILYRPD
jgi:transmembrane sensor